MIRRTWLYAAAITLAAASFNCAASDSYTVSVNLLYQGDSYATPKMIVKPNVPARMTMSGTNGFELSVTVSEINSEKLKVATRLQSPHGSIAPDLVVHPGQPATAKVGPLGITVTVTSNGS